MQNNGLFKALMLVLISFAWTSCHKDKEINGKDPIVSKEEMTVSGTQARFEWCVDFSGQFQTGLELSQNENMTDVRRIEATKEEGKYVAVVSDLSMGTKYYYRIVVWNKFNNYKEETKSFTTSQTFNVTLSCLPVEGGTVMGNGTYTSDDTCMVKATANEGYRFVNWTENESHISAEAEYTFAVTSDRNLVAYFEILQPDEFFINVSANPSQGGMIMGGGAYIAGDTCTLIATANQGYHFVSWMENGNEVQGVGDSYIFTVTGNRTLVANFTELQPDEYSITVSANLSGGGTVTGSGTYQQGQSCTVTATANDGYSFVNWTENGVQVYSNAEYTFTVTGNRTLVANFTCVSPTYTITVYAIPSDGGTVSGGGTYNYDMTVNLQANANSGFTFDHWQDGNTNNPRSITVMGNATYTAYFTAQSQVPQGAINGQFTINSSDDKVFFSKGNLQYNKTTQVWSFMEHQYDIVESQNQDVGENYANQNIISLFGWGTSGWNNGNVYYQPWNTKSNGNSNQGYGYGPADGTNYSYNLTDAYSQADWGVHNSISNTTGSWRTLTQLEWNHVFNERTGICYAKAQITGTSKGTVNGIILFPDDWSTNIYNPSNYNESEANFSSNSIPASQWLFLEEAGAVFLPAAGGRNGTLACGVGNYGYYWSTSCNGSSYAHDVYFDDIYLYTGLYMSSGRRCYGFPVRLVYPCQ